jgi:leucyl-tRNA---protein transferase
VALEGIIVADLSSRFPRFFVTAPGPCPYIEGQTERKIFTELVGDDAALQMEALGNVGFRRSQSVAYRPACTQCNACVPVRVRAMDFVPSVNMKKTIKRNQDVQVYACDTLSTDEQFTLLQRYLSERHPHGGMAHMDVYDFADMIERTSVNTTVYEYREPEVDGKVGALIGVCLTDQTSDGYSMVYSFYDPQSLRTGLGNYIIIDHILRAADHKFPHVYLGYWIAQSRKMSYKTRFRPVEMLTPTGWLPLEIPEDVFPGV